MSPMHKEEKTFRFKTNINCGSCVEKVTPALNEAEGVCHWKVDTTSKDKILMVHSTGITEEAIKEIVKSAGFNAELINP